MIYATTKNTVHFPNIFIKDDMRHIAEKIMVPVMQKNIYDEVALDGGRQTEIEKKTVTAKIKKGLSPKILTARGKLRIAFVVDDYGNGVKIHFNEERADIAEYLQVKGIRSKKYGKKYFNFFGISSIMEKNAIVYMRKRIKEIFKNGKK